MRIVCVIDESPDGISFANRIHDELGVDLAIVALPRPPGEVLLRKYRSSGAGGVLDASRERLAVRLSRTRAQRACDRWLGRSWTRLESAIPTLRTTSINTAPVASRVAALGEVLLLVHCDVILGDALLRSCAVGLNLHWGLSPHYRGTRCTEWALLHWDPYNIGVTLHHLTEDVDGGAIVGQSRATVAPNDTVRALNAQLTALGTRIAVDAGRALRAGADLSGVPQDLEQGFVTYKRQWSGALGRHVAALERAGLDRMLAAPSRGPLPIVELFASNA